MEEDNIRYNPMQRVKRHFFAMRNGVIADVLRRAGSPYRIIFGLNLPQIVDISKEVGPSRELAESLWNNTTTRESVLLAPMLVPRKDFTADDALRWVQSVPDYEAADILCHRLLRHMPYALSLARELTLSEGLEAYTGMRLVVNIMYANMEDAVDIAESVVKSGCGPEVLRLARQVMEEAKECGLQA